MEQSEAKVKIVEYLQTHSQPVSLFQLVHIVLQNKCSDAEIGNVLSQLFEEKLIYYTSQGIIGAPHNLMQLIEQVQEEDTRNILECFFRGQNIPSEQRSNVHQIVKLFLQNRRPIDEDSYKNVFRKYRFTQNSFCTIFSQPVSTYLYLSQICKKGKLDWRQIGLDSSQPTQVRSAAINAIKTEGLLLEGTVLPCTVEDVGLYLLQRHKTSAGKDDLFLEYVSFLDQAAPLPDSLTVSKHRFISILSASNRTILGQAGALRFRQSKERTDCAMVKRLKLWQYRNQYVSAEIIYKNAVAEMEKSDIQSPYELITILKQFPEICAKYQLTFAKAPFLIFGTGNAASQLLNLLKEFSPISGDRLAQEYERRYGLKATTVKTQLLKEISPYLRNGVYDLQTRSITDKQIQAIAKKLTKPWYTVEDVQKIFKSKVGAHYEAYLSTENLRKIGFRKTNVIIYSSQYRSLIECLEKNEWAGNTFYVSNEMWENPQIYTALQKQAAKFEIIEYLPQKFIRLAYLKRNGIHKKNLYEFIDEVCDRVQDDAYFTLKFLRDQGYEFPLDDLGFDDTFYYSVLKQGKKIQGKKVAGTYLFRKSKQDVTLSDFIESLVSQVRSIDIFDLSELIGTQYGIALAPSYIRFLVSDSQMYYDSISEKIYLDYDEYFEEV